MIEVGSRYINYVDNTPWQIGTYFCYLLSTTSEKYTQSLSGQCLLFVRRAFLNL